MNLVGAIWMRDYMLIAKVVNSNLLLFEDFKLIRLCIFGPKIATC